MESFQWSNMPLIIKGMLLHWNDSIDCYCPQPGTQVVLDLGRIPCCKDVGNPTSHLALAKAVYCSSKGLMIAFTEYTLRHRTKSPVLSTFQIGR